MWAARDDSGDLYLYAQEPSHDDGRSYYGEENDNGKKIPEEWFPNLKFEDGPIEIIGLKAKDEHFTD